MTLRLPTGQQLYVEPGSAWAALSEPQLMVIGLSALAASGVMDANDVGLGSMNACPAVACVGRASMFTGQMLVAVGSLDADVKWRLATDSELDAMGAAGMVALWSHGPEQ